MSGKIKKMGRRKERGRNRQVCVVFADLYSDTLADCLSNLEW